MNNNIEWLYITKDQSEYLIKYMIKISFLEINLYIR